MLQHRHPRALARLLILALALPTLTLAHEERSHGAHTHGLARLDLAVEGGALLIGLESPAANIVGFEHAPANARERAALDAALATLKDGGRLFRLPADAGCRLVEAVVETPLAAKAGEAAHASDHADIEAEYRFECAEPGRLVQMRLGLFDAFPQTQRLQVQFVGPRGQGAAELTAANPVLRF